MIFKRYDIAKIEVRTNVTAKTIFSKDSTMVKETIVRAIVVVKRYSYDLLERYDGQN